MNYQSKAWMKRISKFRKYKNQAKGERHPKHRLTEKEVMRIRKNPSWLRLYICERHGISERHWYHIRQGKRWSHL